MPTIRRLRPVEPQATVLSQMDRPIPPRRFGRRHWTVAALGIAVLGGSTWWYVKFALQRTIEVSPNQVAISAVTYQTFRDYVPAMGAVMARNPVYLDAVDGGQISEVLVEEGALVTAGLPLVRLKNTNLQLEVLGREAQLAEQLDRLSATTLSFEQARLQHQRDRIDARAQIAKLSRRVSRYAAIAPSGGVSQSDLDETNTELERYRATEIADLEAARTDEQAKDKQLAQMQNTLETTRKNLLIAHQTIDDLLVKAPIAGQLTSLEAHVGEYKAAGQRIGEIDDVSAIKVQAAVDEFYLGRLQIGQRGTTNIDGSAYRLDVSKIYPQVSEHQFKVDLLFAQPSPTTLRRGQTVELRLEVGTARRSLVLANGPFYDDSGGKWAFVLDADGRVARRREIHLGRRTPEQIEVLSGLSATERVLTSGYESLRKFDTVKIRK